MTEKIRPYREIEADYKFDADIMTQKDERANLVLQIVQERLTKKDRALLLLYLEYKSFRKLGERMHCSHTKVMQEIHRIRQFIRDEYSKTTSK